ncbi:MAG: divalent-cation tolerance protein CutA [candidate division Zixibacteria bacterium]|jgi:periplasmic divalent cation tolerance protein|nr:divalent-cation tolerance protein CutA [candidate division Zixibacteria bacterium]
MENIRVVFISIPRDEAGQFGRQLVANRLCACVNVVPKIESYFWWDGEVEKDEESLLLVKTTQDRFPELMAWVKENHPYDVPEVISVPLAGGLPEYVAWVKDETSK